MLQLLKTLGTKIVGGVSGPLGWLASLLIDRIITFGWRKLTQWIEQLKKNREMKKAKSEDQKRSEDYNETLKDGSTIKKQVDSSLDVLNGTDRRNHP